MSEIAISIDVSVLAGIEFWIERDEWEALDDTSKKAKIDERATEVAAELDKDVLRFRTATLSAQIIDIPTDLSKVQIYDPEA